MYKITNKVSYSLNIERFFISLYFLDKINLDQWQTSGRGVKIKTTLGIANSNIKTHPETSISHKA